VDVELAGRHTYGRTVIDFADRTKLGFIATWSSRPMWRDPTRVR